MNKIILLGLLLLSIMSAYSQNRTITGKVTDGQTNEPVVGASVLVQGSKNGTSTNASGNFSLEVPAGTVTLTASFIGYTAKTITVQAGQSTLSVQLIPQDNALDEVVVTALGIHRKPKELTYNVQEIKSDEVTRVKDASFVNSLTGKIAGVTINSTPSPGGSTRVVMRGVKSIANNNGALYVIDGIPMQPLASTGQAGDSFGGTDYGDGIANIDPENIASISILSGASAAALYGGQAANGVVMIETKKGSTGKTKVSFSSDNTFSSPFTEPEVQNKYGSLVSSEGNKSFSSWGDALSSPKNYQPNDFFQTGNNFNNSVSVSTGTERSQTFVSASSLNSRGIIPNNKLNRYSISGRNTSSFANDKLNLDLGITYINQGMDNPPYSGQYVNPLVPIYLFPRGDDLQTYKEYERYDPSRNLNVQYWPYGDQTLAMQNPYWTVNRMLTSLDRERFMGNLGLTWKLNDWLKIGGRARIDNASDFLENKRYASTLELFTGSPNGSYNQNTTTNRQVYADLLLTANKKFQDFSLVAVLGGSIMNNRTTTTGAGGALAENGIPNFFSTNNIDQEHISGTGNAAIHNETQALFMTATLGFKDYLFLDLTGRNDWISQLAFANKNSTFYPSVGLSAIVSDMVQMPSWFSFAKVRSSLSYVGNPPGAFLTNPSYPVSSGVVNPIGAVPFQTLKPEKTQSVEVGTDLRFFRDKLSLSVTYYNTNTSNQIFTIAPPAGVGYSSYYVNAGKINNQGVEASLGYQGKFGDLTWNPSVVFSLNRNKIKETLRNYYDPFDNTYKSQDSLSGGPGVIAEGGTLSDIYQKALQRDANGKIITDDDGNPLATLKTIKVGRASPDFNLGFNNTFTYKNISLGFLIDGRFGGQVVSATQAIMDGFGASKASADLRDAGGININGKQFSAQDYYQNVLQANRADLLGEYVYSATNVRLRELNIGYTFPAHVFSGKIQSLGIGFTARNLFMLHNDAPFDPELSMATGSYLQGFDYFMQPSLRSYGVNLKVVF
ncbi:TonB-linked outer membrane protein, SusC/RagA family [bacterium A37T11]|nr:TonB-linked outer membrane protein, SusC/RagA family [bacterium A37T11]